MEDLFLGASGAVEDRMEGLGPGVADYLGKKFAFGDLVASIRNSFLLAVITSSSAEKQMAGPAPGS